MSRLERLEYAEALLLAACQKYGRIRISAFIKMLQYPKHLGVTEPTALSYWEALKTNQKFKNNNFEVWLA